MDHAYRDSCGVFITHSLNFSLDALPLPLSSTFVSTFSMGRKVVNFRPVWQCKQVGAEEHFLSMDDVASRLV
jgi:hypothetical protein